MGDILEISTPSQSHSNQLSNGISRLLDSEDDVGSDFEFLCAGDSTPIKAHFFVLQIFCRVLQNSNCRRICFESAEIQREDVRCLLEFIYRGKTRVKVERLDAVKRAALKLRLETFLDLVDRGIQIESVDEEVKNETDTENEEEVCESLAVDEDNVEEDEDSSSIDCDYTECSKDEEQKSNVVKHQLNGGMRKHLAFKRYDLRSYQSGNLNAHLPTKHQMDSNGQVLKKTVKCKQCKYNCATELILEIHIKNAHCAANKDKLKRRKLSIHSSARSHACETCGKCFRDAGYLRKHKMVHAAKVDCEFCGKKFSLRSIWGHRQLHEVGGIKKFKCTICPQRCSRRFDLKRHIRRNHDMSEEEIVQLVKSQAVRISDKDPPKTESSDKKWFCEVCGVFVNASKRIRHRRRLHMDGDRPGTGAGSKLDHGTT